MTRSGRLRCGIGLQFRKTRGRRFIAARAVASCPRFRGSPSPASFASRRQFRSPFPIPHSRFCLLTMPSYASPPPPRSGDVAGTLRLLTSLALSVPLIVLDHRGDLLPQVLAQHNPATPPPLWLAGLPAPTGDRLRAGPAVP